ncbi:MAG: GAF domain-containing protein [Candidatus Binatia bacterium]
MTTPRLPASQSLASPEADVLEVTRTHVREVLARTEGNPGARERHAEFQALIAELASDFIGLDANELETALGGALERIASFAGAQRAALVRLDPATSAMNVTHEWAADHQRDVLRSIDGLTIMGWTAEQLRRGVILHLEDASEIPKEAVQEKKAWEIFSIQSIVAIPVRSLEGELFGFAAFATTTRKAGWRHEEMLLFDLAAGMLRSALEQQRLRRELERSELRLSKLLESGVLGILSADSDGRIWEANDAALLVTGASRSDLETGRLRWDAITPPEYRPMTMGALEQLERSGCSEPWEQDVYRRDGSRVAILVCLARIAESPDRFLIYAVDITVDKKAQRELTLRNRLARVVTLYSTRLIAVAPARIAETIAEALRETGGVLGIDQCSVWIDEEDGDGLAHCRHVWDRQRGFEGTLKLPPMDRTLFPRWNDDFTHRRPMVVADVAADFPEGAPERRFLASHGVHSGVAVPLVSGEHSIGFVTFGTVNPVEWPDSTVSLLSVVGEIFAAALVRGRIEEKQHRVHAELEARIVERTTLLESANRELEAFSYAVSHDLRAPLRGVDGFSRILVEDHAEGLPAGARAVLDRICTTSRRMGELIDALLRLSRITRVEPHFEPVDLSSLVRELAASLTAADPGRCVEFRIEEGLRVHGEPRLLTAMMDNLLRNAWKFTGPHPRACIEFGVQHEGDRRVYFVRDDGVGFDPSQAERLFTPFQRLHDPREFEGHGVGLATVKRIVGVHGGKVWGIGATGQGATIRFTLGDRE